MLRSAPLRRTCPDIIKARIEAASKLHLFVVQEMGPMAFIVKDATAAVIVNSGTQNEPNNTQSIHDDTKANMRQPPDRSNVKSYKVTLGNFQSCNCHTHLIENDLCVHILWVMIKVFRVSLESDVLYQNSLVEREIAELMDSRRRRILPESSDSTVSDIKQNEAPLLKGHVRQRPIEDGDICPICMEDLDINIGAITYCKLSCGNNIHIKCMKILMDHQTKNMGLENIKCPLCRKDFGKYDDLKKELSEGYSTQIKMDNQSRHYGVTCNECTETPIFGKCHRCEGCKEFGLTLHLCDKCYITGGHSQHTLFRHKPTRGSKWILSKPREQVTNLQSPDTPMEAGSSQTPLHIISTFPTETGSRNITRSPCEICLAPFDADSTTRTIPSCAHTFHQPCIDRWLLMHVNTCPTCKVPAFHRVERMGEEIAMGPGILEEASFIPAPTSSGVAWMDAAAQRRRGKGGKPSSKNSPKSELGMDSNDGRGMGAMVIVGSRSFPGGPTNADKVTPPMPLASSLGSVSGSERHSVMHPREKIHQGRSTVGGTSPPKPTRLPPLFTQQQQQMQKTKSQIHLANSITQHHQASPTVAFGSTLSTASLTQAHALTLRSGTQNHPKEFPTPKLLFEDLLVSQSLSKLSLSQNLVAVAAEADTLPASGDQIPGFADSEISVPSRTVSLVHGSSSVPAPIAKRSPPQAVPHLHPSLPGPFFKPSLAKRRYLPHTSLSAIENPPLNVNALIECVTYNGSTTNLGVLEMGTGATLYVRDSGGKGSPMKGGSVLPKIPIQNVRRRQK